MTDEMVISISKNGEIVSRYNETFLVGDITECRRISDVNPKPSDPRKWRCDFRFDVFFGGKGAETPDFDTRSQALEFEAVVVDEIIDRELEALEKETRELTL